MTRTGTLPLIFRRPVAHDRAAAAPSIVGRLTPSEAIAAPAEAATKLGITVYGCEPDEAALFDALAPRLGVVPTMTSAAASEVALIPVPGNRCISVGHKSAITRPVLRALKANGVGYISTRSIGFDHIDLHSAEEMGITVENVAYAPDGVADYTVMLILMAIRNAKDIIRAAGQHDFSLRRSRGRELRDLTVGVAGTGRIGRAVIDRLHGFGCRVLACGKEASAAEQVSRDDLLARSDVVSLHLPLNAETRHLIGPRQLDAMKPGAFLVNTGRGALVDTIALVGALERGKLAGAALDVLEGEEGIFYFDRTGRPIDHPLLLRLLAMPNVILTPHTAYHTERVLHDAVRNSILNCLNFAGETAS